MLCAEAETCQKLVERESIPVLCSAIFISTMTMSFVSQELEKDEKSRDSSLVEVADATGLSGVFKRHGRADLVPVPSDDPQDPLNWPSYVLQCFDYSRSNTLATGGERMFCYGW